MRRTKIVCTIGPATESPAMLKKLLTAGMDVVRLNLSHGIREEHAERIEKIRTITAEMGKVVALLLDTRGPEVRVKTFQNGSTFLKEGDLFTLTTKDVEGDENTVAVTYHNLHQEVAVGNRILLDDGLLAMEIMRLEGQEIICKVITGGELFNRKGINIPGVALNLPALSEKDIEDIRFGIRQGIDFIAASFVRKPEDVIAIREIIEQERAQVKIIAKIENEEGSKNIDAILDLADGIMIARGDLGVEIPAEDVPLVQKELIKKCNLAGKPVITATQMLDSMMRNPRPTRAEASDVANAILDGTDAVMLSGETAIGKYPLLSVETMARIAERTEQSLQFESILKQTSCLMEHSVTDAISFATCHTAQILEVSAIISSSQSGYTARMVSKYRPKANILAVTPNKKVANQLSLTWGISPLLSPPMKNTDEMFEAAIKVSLKAGYVQTGDVVVITAGIPVGVAGTTNLLRVHTIGKAIIKGIGIGRKSVTGVVCLASTLAEATEIKKGEILVTAATDSEYLSSLEKAAGLITEEGGLTSHGAIVGLNFGIPVITGAENALKELKNGEIVTIDATRGLVYRGKTTVL